MLYVLTKKTIIGEFDIIIKPRLNPELSDFCTQLTTITQEMLNDVPEFPEAFDEFKKWINDLEDQYMLCSWGYYDRVQFKNDCELHGLDSAWTEPYQPEASVCKV